MTRKKKIRRFFIVAACVYVIINLFVYGLMTAYMNTNNTVSSKKVVMADVSADGETTKVNILGKEFSLQRENEFDKAMEATVYIAMPFKIRLCTELLIHLNEML